MISVPMTVANTEDGVNVNPSSSNVQAGVDVQASHLVPVTLSVNGGVVLLGSTDAEAEVDAELGAAYSSVDAPTYTGTYVVTPSDEGTVLLTKEKYLLENVVVEPIPSNYGKITWDGYKLTVS